MAAAAAVVTRRLVVQFDSSTFSFFSSSFLLGRLSLLSSFDSNCDEEREKERRIELGLLLVNGLAMIVLLAVSILSFSPSVSTSRHSSSFFFC